MTEYVRRLCLIVCMSAAVVLLQGVPVFSQGYLAIDYFTDPKVVQLAEAALRGDVARIDALVAEGVDVNAIGREGMTPLLYATFGTQTKGIKRLLEHGADPNHRTEDGDSALAVAVRAERPEWGTALLKMLLQHGGDPNLRTLESPSAFDWQRYGPTLIFDAASHHIARVLIKAGADMEVRNDEGETPLLAAASQERLDIAYVLLAAGADFRVKDAAGRRLAQYLLTARLSATSEAEAWRRECIEFLRKAGVDMQKEKAEYEARQGVCGELYEETEGSGKPSENLSNAKQKPAAREAQQGERHSSRPMGRRSEAVGDTASEWDDVHPVLTPGDPRFGAPPPPSHFFDDPKLRSLAEAAACGDVTRIDALVRQGVDVNAAGKAGVTPLLYALMAANEKGFRRLLEHGADPNYKLPSGYSPVHFAACRGDPTYLKLLLQHGADPNLRHPLHDSITMYCYPLPRPIHWAVAYGRPGCVRVLIDAGANPDALDFFGFRPLLQAIAMNHYDVAYVLIDGGAHFRIGQAFDGARVIFHGDIDLVSHQAAWREKCIKLLEKKGVDFSEDRRQAAEVFRRVKRLAREIDEEMKALRKERSAK